MHASSWYVILSVVIGILHVTVGLLFMYIRENRVTTDWDPKDAMGLLSCLKFRGWVHVNSVPEWVQEATRDYYRGYQNKYGQRPYDVSKDFSGDSLQYHIKYVTVSQGKVEPEYYVKIR